MKTLTAEELRNNIKTLNVDYISGLSKETLLYCADIILDIKVKKSDNKLNIAKPTITQILQQRNGFS